MESLNLHTLANSLPNAQQNAEKELSNDFKAAALSITTLYRSSRKNAKRAYNAGYAAACQDLLTMIQQGVSLNAAGTSHDVEGGGMTIGRVMDWTEARLEELRSREEEEDEEEEREKEKESGRARAAATVTIVRNDKAAKANVTTASAPPCKDNQPPSLPTPKSPHSHLNAQPPSEPSSPSPPPPGSTLRPIQRPMRPRGPAKGDVTASYGSPLGEGAEFINDGISSVPPASVPLSDIPIPIAAGAKRRHAVMMMLDSSTPPVAIGSSSTTYPSSTGAGNNTNSVTHGSGSVTSRRRTRSTRNLALQQSQNQNIVLSQAASEAMDVEEDGGRERKRVARR
ncbi:hypothetical protein Hypma_000494 [Hypsizygus marmoreus]|uniref:Uncharacterized protein n=1 Tax=Hypsizygus marmoreus TaxID=39966 RepID=A0A369JCZ1_HYPMA|nr:hypothetical protein Hypma_000494 [Hypsizygus marmoreus]